MASSSGPAQFDREINCLSDQDRMKRKGALKRLLDAVRKPDAGTWDAAVLQRLTSECLRRFEDTSENCREQAIAIVRHATPLQDAAVLDYVLPSVAARIGTDPIREESEELRLQLLDLAHICLDHFANDLGAYIDYYPVVLTNCLADPFPELKRKACAVAIRLCEIEPKRVKSCTVSIAKAVKQHALTHKHAVVRCDAVKCFGVLVAHGAAEMLGDMKDEQDNRTTVFAIYQLANDRSDPVRKATLEVMNSMLLDISEKAEQPRRLLPHVLSLVTDPCDDIRADAQRLLEQLGKLYRIDNANHDIDLSKRPVTIKDIEWYADDEYPDMTLTTSSSGHLPDLDRRPTLGARHAVAEHVRHFLDNLLGDATAVNWMIPHSLNNRRTVALRTLVAIIIYSESNIVQYAQQILQALYKVVRDDDKEVAGEGLLCAELMGKFMRVDQYLPFLVAKSDDTDDAESTRKTHNKTITMLNADGTPAIGTNKLPTLFSTAGNVTKASILTVMRLLLRGATKTLTAEQAKMIVRALTDTNLANLDAPELMKNLISAQQATCEMLIDRGFVVADVAPEAPRTLDSMLVYAMIAATAAEDSGVVAAADAAVAAVSEKIFGEGKKGQVYQQHFGRWIKRHLVDMPPAALQRLITNTPDLTPHSQFLTDLFVQRLSNIKFNVRVSDELALYQIMETLLEGQKMTFTADQLEIILRAIVMPHLGFQPGPAAALFRKLAFATLRAMLRPFHRKALTPALSAEDGALSDKVVTHWLGGVDSDDHEMRFSCIDCTDDVCQMPMAAGTGSEVVDHMVSGLNDSSDHLRHLAATKLRQVLYNGSDVATAVVAAVHAKVASMTEMMLVHLDDVQETLGIRDQLVLCLKRLKAINPDLVTAKAQQAKSKHAIPKYLDELLHFEPNQ